jgi:hypothetical protein
MGMTLRLLSGLASGRTSERDSRELRWSPRQFEQTWKIFLSKRTEADFQAWREQRDWTARKYALWDAGKKLEPPNYGPWPNPTAPDQSHKETAFGWSFCLYTIILNMGDATDRVRVDWSCDISSTQERRAHILIM